MFNMFKTKCMKCLSVNVNMKKAAIILSILLLCLLIGKYVFLNQIIKQKGYENYANYANYSNKVYNEIQDSQLYSHTVDLPINTRFSCANMCGPPARCSITGEQCTSDVDCSGCMPRRRKIKKEKEGFTNQTSSSLKASQSASLEPYFQGINTWRAAFDLGNANYQKKYNADLNSKPFLLHYPKQTSLSGEFEEEGPYTYNAYTYKPV